MPPVICHQVFSYLVLLIKWHYVLCQVRQLLVDDPGNAEYADMRKELEEVM